jgi:dolichol-phosphate mannosyltransferase
LRVKSQKISIVLPVFNEEDGIEFFHKSLLNELKKLPKYTFELLYIDDGSTDGSTKKLSDISTSNRFRNIEIKILRLSRNFGHQNAIFCGIEMSSGVAVITMDTDLQDPPSVIPKMLRTWENGAEIVLARRITRSGESAFKKLSAKLFYRALNWVSETPIPIDVGDFRLIGEKGVEALLKACDQNLYIRGAIAWIGFPQEILEYHRDSRDYGVTKYPFRKMMALGMNGVINYSMKPLRFAMWLALFSGISALILLSFIVGSTILNPDHVQSGYASLATMILFGFALQMFCLGVFGEYIAKIVEESRKRPRYILGETIER